MADETPSSFAKSLFFGHIPEEMVIPYPRPSQLERDQLAELIARFRAFADEHIDSRAIDERAALGDEVLRGLGALGLFGLSVPNAYGGLGLSATAYARAMQEIAATDGAIAITLAAHHAIGLSGLVLFGSEAQKQKYLPKLAAGAELAAFALSEPTAGSDAASIKTRAVEQPDGSFVLDGGKIWITNGGTASLFTVFAQSAIERDGQTKDRISAFLVERAMGVRSGPEAEKLGVRGASTTSLTLDHVRVPRENLLGDVGGGFKVAQGILNHGRLGLAASCVGVARNVLRLAISHALSRRQFGRGLTEFGMIKDKLARMTMETFAAESMIYLTCGLVDRGVTDYSIESACCKVYGSEMLLRVVNEGALLAGGGSYMRELPWERLLRDARANLVFEGTNEILRCFIALSGMTGPGERLAQLSDFIKWPLKGYGLAIDFVVDKLKTQYVGGATLDRAHSMLKKEAVAFEDWVPELSKAVEKKLRQHGKLISEMQFVQRRVADIVIDLYLMVACIARTTAELAEKGPGAEREARLCRAVCGRAAGRIKRNIRNFDDNDDELLKQIARDAVDAAQYPFDVVLG